MSVTKEILERGHNPGHKPRLGDTIYIVYEAFAFDHMRPQHKGQLLDSSRTRGSQGLTLGTRSVIPGLEIGIVETDGGMEYGERALLTVNSHLAFGAHGFPGIVPSNSTVIFDVVIHPAGSALN